MTKRAAIYARVSTSKQTTDNQMIELQDTAKRLGWAVSDVYEDHGISGGKGRGDRPAFDELHKAVARGEVDVIMAWSVDRLGRSLQDLVMFLNEVHEAGVDVFIHQQGINTATSPSSRMMFQLLGVFAEFERGIIRSRINAGLDRARSQGKKLGRPGLSDYKINRIRKQLTAGHSVRVVADMVHVSTGSVSKVKKQMLASVK
ncbi:MAG: recombinase family protein [Methylocystaceae bacterium]|nr:recombinase family protein [Methylocystaceae bacterium]